MKITANSIFNSQNFSSPKTSLTQAFNRLSKGLNTGDSKSTTDILSDTTEKSQNKNYANSILAINETISLFNIADNAVSNLKKIVEKQSELATQATATNLSSEMQQALDDENQALATDYQKIINTTVYNNINPLNGSSSVFSVSAGVNLTQASTSLLSSTNASSALTEFSNLESKLSKNTVLIETGLSNLESLALSSTRVNELNPDVDNKTSNTEKFAKMISNYILDEPENSLLAKSNLNPTTVLELITDDEGVD